MRFLRSSSTIHDDKATPKDIGAVLLSGEHLVVVTGCPATADMWLGMGAVLIGQVAANFRSPLASLARLALPQDDKVVRGGTARLEPLPFQSNNVCHVERGRRPESKQPCAAGRNGLLIGISTDWFIATRELPGSVVTVPPNAGVLRLRGSIRQRIEPLRSE